MRLDVNSIFARVFTISKKSLQYKASRRDFYEGQNYLSNQTRVLNLTDNLRNTTEIRTEKDIRFYGLKFGSSKKEALKHLGKPNYTSSQKSILNNHKVLFYRLTLSKVKCILQLHFLDDDFFLGVIEARTNTSQVSREITDLIRKKYEIDNPNWQGLIRDKDNHSIEVSEGMIQRIVYQSGMPEHMEKIAERVERLKQIKEKHGLIRHEVILEMI